MKKALPRIDLTKIPTVIIRHERRYPVRFSKIFIAAYYRIGKQAGCSPPSSGVFENQSPTVVQLDLRCMPCMIARNLLLGLMCKKMSEVRGKGGYNARRIPEVVATEMSRLRLHSVIFTRRKSEAALETVPGARKVR